MKRLLLVLSVSLIAMTGLFAEESWINTEDAPVQVFAELEGGFVSVLGHTIKIGSGGIDFDYVNQGGQDVLFPFKRFTFGATLFDRHRVSFLYQPLEVNTTVRMKDDIIIDGVTFNNTAADGERLDLKYGFPFYRASYSYDLLSDENKVLGVGGALQIRNASIIFASGDGTKVTVSQNVGVVPALHVYSRLELDSGLNFTADATGIYASSAIINGASYQFEGSLLDASLRMGYRLKGNNEIYGALRFVGGTSDGTTQDTDRSWSESVEKYTANNLALLTVSMGLAIR
jgi:hypothetical protein